MENSIEVSKKIKELPRASGTPLLGTYSKKSKTLFEKTYTPLYSFQHYLQQPTYESNLGI